ncbi:MAG: COX15/CtaA family protein [Bacteroidota bacterium]
MTISNNERLWLHRYAIFAALWIVALIFFGAQVKSTSSGLSVPDWPNTYGHFMFSFPWEKMVGGIFWEHSHRMIASVAGLFTFALTIATYRIDERKWVKRLSLWASIAVLVQGLLGGLTVLFYLPTWLSSSHGTLAQIYLCIVVCVAVVTSPRWSNSPATSPDGGRIPLRNLVLATTGVIFLQLIFGALMRHSDAGLAIPDFPTMFGSWIPPLSDARLAAANHELRDLGLLWKRGMQDISAAEMFSHVLHRAWAVVVTGMVLWTVIRVWRERTEPAIRRPAFLLLGLLVAQVTLGILTILTEKQFTVASLHLLNGALTLATSVVLAIQVRHLLRAPNRDAVPASQGRARVAVPSGRAVEADEVGA